MANISTGNEPRRRARNESIDWPVDSSTSGPPELRRFIDFLRRRRLPGRLPSEPLRSETHVSGRTFKTPGFFLFTRNRVHTPLPIARFYSALSLRVPIPNERYNRRGKRFRRPKQKSKKKKPVPVALYRRNGRENTSVTAAKYIRREQRFTAAAICERRKSRETYGERPNADGPSFILSRV